MKNPTLIVLAAGIGSRYGGLKQVDPIGPNGEMLIDYSIYDALRAGFNHVVFVINRRIEDIFKQKVGGHIEPHCRTSYVFQDLDDVPDWFSVPPERKKPWGTGHATLVCRDVVDAPFAVINGDDFYGRTSFQVLGDFLKQAEDKDGLYDCSMVGFAIENTLSDHGSVARGVCKTDDAGNLLEVHERTRIERSDAVGNDSVGGKFTEDGETWTEVPAGTPVSMNMWGFTLGFMEELGTRFPSFLERSSDIIEKAEFFLPLPVNELLSEGKATVKVLPTKERWFGVTYQQDKPRVIGAIAALIERGIYPEDLWA
jgi:UTP-glucose-1-phosphate uridylyltransferase